MMNRFIDLEHFVDSIKNQLGSFFLPSCYHATPFSGYQTDSLYTISFNGHD
ncbi:hypothetical protein ACIQ4Z_04200 [Peribacillus asahii]|uniref:hypothetical protein n=1 Tax=Peribacillus asahii TaxID=228899 RepID=UPI0038059A7B